MMENFKALAFISIAATISVSLSVEGQIVGSPCTASVINNFTPCFNAITGSSNDNNNGSSSSQKQSCCTTLRSLSGLSMDCACLLLTANVPVPLPINTALSLILPTSCNITNLPSQCKASVSTLPSPGPISLGPTAPTPTPTAAASPLSPQVSKAEVVALAPESERSEAQQLSPSYSPGESPAPETTHHRIRPVVSPSASAPSCFCPPSLLVISIAMIMVFKSH